MIEKEIATVSRMPAVGMILDVVTEMTGMRFAAVARVTETQRIVCAVKDGIDFGLVPGDQLPLETTFCNEIRQHKQTIVFGSASEHPTYSLYPTPKLYKFESYISVPIFRGNGDFLERSVRLIPVRAAGLKSLTSSRRFASSRS